MDIVIKSIFWFDISFIRLLIISELILSGDDTSMSSAIVLLSPMERRNYS